ncbi:MAG: hypothetical protein AAF291_14535 [Pseudomonadota bacterium]
MKAHTTPFAGALGLAAALAMSAPASAASGMPTAPPAPMTGSALTLADTFSSNPVRTGIQTSDWRRCGFFGCRRGFRRGWRGRGWRGRRGIGIGGVLAGAAVIGGIAAIASANNNRRRDREVVVVERDRRDDDRRFDDRRSNPRSSGSSGLDSAVSQCLREIERDVRVDTVDGASRVSSGWVVTGSIFDGSGFSCEIGNDGRIADVQYGRFRGSDAGQLDGAQRAAAGQWSDDRYANARSAMSGSAPAGSTTTTYSTAERFADASAYREERPAQPLVPLTSDQMPAYPGGPLPGEATGQ